MKCITICAALITCSAWMTGCSTNVWTPTGDNVIAHKAAWDICLPKTRKELFCDTYRNTHMISRLADLMVHAIYDDEGGWCETVMQACMEEHGWILRKKKDVVKESGNE